MIVQWLHKDLRDSFSENNNRADWKQSRVMKLISIYRVRVVWKSHGKWFLFSRPGTVMEFVKKRQMSWKSHGFSNTDFDYENA